jgi:cytochrome bd-type quinol oxidase subunit 1
MNYILPIENYKSTVEPTIAELRENCISSRSQHFHKLGIIFSQLHEVALLINSTYGFSLLCGTCWVFFNITLGVNYVIEIKQTGIHTYVFATVFGCSFYVALMAIVAMSCSLAVNKCNRSPVIVQKIMLRDDIESEEMEELKKIFIQFKVMKIKFSACELYDIDLSFFCEIIGVTFSYLIIFSQL